MTYRTTMTRDENQRDSDESPLLWEDGWDEDDDIGAYGDLVEEAYLREYKTLCHECQEEKNGLIDGVCRACLAHEFRRLPAFKTDACIAREAEAVKQKTEAARRAALTPDQTALECVRLMLMALHSKGLHLRCPLTTIEPHREHVREVVREVLQRSIDRGVIEAYYDVGLSYFRPGGWYVYSTRKP